MKWEASSEERTKKYIKIDSESYSLNGMMIMYRLRTAVQGYKGFSFILQFKLDSRLSPFSAVPFR